MTENMANSQDHKFDQILSLLYSLRNEVESIKSKMENSENSHRKLEERITNLETEKWFAATIGASEYTPEPKRREPLGRRLLEYGDTFSLVSSPYRW